MKKKGLIITTLICAVIVIAGLITIFTVSGVRKSKENKAASATATDAPSEQYVNGLKIQEVENEIVITDTEINEGEVQIPNEINGLPVVKIAYGAFTRKQISKVVIPGSVKFIDKNAFAYCSSLSEVVFADGLEEISDKAFYSCTSLTQIDLPDSLKKIGNNTFENCEKLTAFTCPEELTHIGKYALSKCESLTDISFNEKLRKIEKGAFAENSALVTVEIPDNVKSLGDRLFYECSSLENVTFPKDLKMIPVRAFQSCSSLKKIVLPEKTIIIKKAAFSDCENLEKVVFNDKLVAIGDQAFSGNKKMVHIPLKDKVQFIGNGAFRDTVIESIKLSDNLAYIGNGVFSGCAKLKSINIPARVKGIGKGVFRDCLSLSSINVNTNNEYYSSLNGVLYDKAKTVLLVYPENKRDVSYTSPTGMAKVVSGALREHKYLQVVNISARKIKRYSFYNMKKLRKVTINGNDTIEVNAFSNNKKLRSVNINENRILGTSAFASCENLQVANISKCDVIGTNAFEDCFKLTSVSLPVGLRKIKAYAFDGANVRTINIPSTLIELDKFAFIGNKNLAAFTGGSANYVVQDGILFNSNKSVLIKYPAQKSGSSFVVPDSVQRLKYRAFEHNSHLKTLYLGVNCGKLAGSSINKCNKLKTIMFYTKNIDRVAGDAFSGCKNLSIVVGPNNRSLKYATEAVEASFISCG